MSGGRVKLGGAEVLTGVDFKLQPAEFVVLLGANGSGKTTLVRALLGLAPLAGGTVELFGTPLDSFRDWASVGYVPQRVTAVSGVPANVMEVVLSGRTARVGLFKRYGKADRTAATAALEAVDLSDRALQPVSTLSGGQQQRVLIARALAAEPQVLLLDEPVASVDLAHQDSFAQILGDLNRQGTSILLVAHALGAMARLVNRSVVLERGRVAFDGRPGELPLLTDHDHHHPHHEGDTRRDHPL